MRASPWNRNDSDCNRSKSARRRRWFTHCTIRVADRGQRFVFDVDLGPSEISRWTYEFEPTPGGCRVTETWEDRRRSKPIEWIGGIIIPGPRAEHNQWSIETTLQRLKAVAEE